MNREDELLELLREEQVLGAYLFGSRAKGMERAGSDWDIAVLFAPQAPKDVALELKSCLEVQLGESVDVVDLRAAGPELAYAAISGKVLLTSPEVAQWELGALSKYWDFQVFQQHLPPYTQESRERRRQFYQKTLERTLRTLSKA